MLKKILLKILLLAIATLSISCSQNTIDIKSPCVSLEKGPCGPKKSINEWWLKNGNFDQNFYHKS